MATKQDKLAGNNLFIVLLLVTLLVVGVSGLAAKSLITKINRDSKVMAAKIKAEDMLKENLKSAPKLVESYNEMGDKKIILASALPTSADYPSLLVSIETMAALASVKLSSITASSPPAAIVSGTSVATPAPAIGGEPPQKYILTFSFSGNYTELNKFLSEVELNARPMRITSLTLSGIGSSLNGDITLVTYFQDKAKLPIGSEIIK